MTKRKRSTEINQNTKTPSKCRETKSTSTPKAQVNTNLPLTIQLVTGSYDGIVHGVTAIVSPNSVEFADTFLFTAHSSAIRCLALSPPSKPVPNQIQKIYLATGSTDERIHLYHLSAHAPSNKCIPSTKNHNSNPTAENPHNRELGSLLHHSGAITALYFANRGKLLSASEDRQIAIIRTRDWNVLCSVKSPVPKHTGRPSCDTAPVGGAPCGINDFAVHPSKKLMISVSKREKCMRLWNLVTGKKAGVLNFDKKLLEHLGEGKYSTGEGRKVTWGTSNLCEEFCIGFERGLIVYGMDSKPRCKIMPEPRTKIHQIYYLEIMKEDMVLAVSTEDGRIMFYSTKSTNLTIDSNDKDTNALSSAKLVAQLGGKPAGVTGRIKDFSFLTHEGNREEFIIATAGSDGILRLWKMEFKDLQSPSGDFKQTGKLLGFYETNDRITCLEAFTMLPATVNVENHSLKKNSSSDYDTVSESN